MYFTEITVYPTNDPAVDLQSVRDAVNTVAEGGSIVLKSRTEGDPPNASVTPFNFGPDDSLNSIELTKSVTIRGDVVRKEDREYQDPEGWSAGVKEGCGTTIVGGRQPFKVPATAAPPSVAFVDIRFTGFYREAIRIYSTSGTSKITGCSFVDYFKGFDAVDKPKGAWPINADGATDPSRFTGDLFVTENYFGVPPQPSMNNLIHFSNCELTLLDIRHNRIEDMHWMGIAVWGNTGETRIIQNSITKASTYKNLPVIDEGCAISFGLHPSAPLREDGSITIEGNTIDVAAPDTHGIAFFRYKEPGPGKASVIRSNIITMAVGPGVPFQERAAVSILGAAWGEAQCEDNTISGSAPYGIYVSTRKPAAVPGVVTVPLPPSKWSILHPRPMHAQIGDNHLDNFVAGRAQVFVAPEVSAIELRENWFGVIPSSNSHAPPLLPATLKAVIWWQGYMGTMSGNVFSSLVPGWRSSPWIGCIYLDTLAPDNTIEYFENQPPFQLPLPGETYDTNQIFDASGQNTIIRSTRFLPQALPRPKAVRRFELWPIDHPGPTPEREIQMRRTLEVALDHERKAHPDFAEREEDMHRLSRLVPYGTVEEVQAFLDGLYELAKSEKALVHV